MSKENGNFKVRFFSQKPDVRPWYLEKNRWGQPEQTQEVSCAGEECLLCKLAKSVPAVKPVQKVVIPIWDTPLAGPPKMMTMDKSKFDEIVVAVQKKPSLWHRLWAFFVGVLAVVFPSLRRK